MLCGIVKTFPFSRDGVTALTAVAGTVEDIPDDLVEGLAAEGFVCDPDDNEQPQQEKQVDDPNDDQTDLPIEEMDAHQLVERYTALTGEEPDGRWGVSTLREKTKEAAEAQEE